MHALSRAPDDCTMSTVIDAIAAWCAAPQPTSETARRLAREAIADTVACLYAGRDDPSTLAVSTAFGRCENGGAALVTGGHHTPSVAALVNGTSAHALDYDDNFTPGMSHASAVILPALLALVPHVRVRGRDIVDAYLIALQAQAFVGSGVAASHYTAGWHGTSTVGSIGTVAGTAYLLGLNADGIARALTLGASMASGMKGQFGAPAKPFHAGLAARNAVEAALLAARGLHGRFEILEGSQGFVELFGGREPRGYDCAAIAATRDHVIETEGVLPKMHPCCGSTHLIIDALFDQMNETSFDANDVVQVECLVGIANARNLAYPAPKTEMEARFSMQYCVVLALRRKHLSLGDFTMESVAHFATDPLMSKIAMSHYTPEQERSLRRLPHRLRIILADGRVLERERASPRGGLSEPFTDEERWSKFVDCLNAQEHAATMYEALTRLDEQDDLGFLTPLFTGR
jgi:2-methylcitrate dehydratase PrpD